MQLASTWSHELAASSSLVAIKLSNIKVGREAPGMFNYNLDIILCSSTKIKREMYISVCTKRWKGG
jgi:hypothetical protein